MSLETFTEDWRKNDSIDEYRLKEKIEIYEKFVERIQDIVLAYDTEEVFKDIISDLKWELGNVEEGIEEV